jgi:hypothetical protein
MPISTALASCQDILPSHPAGGNAGSALQFAIEYHWPGP